MTFRTEEKILFRSSEQSVFIDEVFKNKNVQKLYGDRIINSLYFDNTSFQMHCESEEGLVPRKNFDIEFMVMIKYSHIQDELIERLKLVQLRVDTKTK